MKDESRSKATKEKLVQVAERLFAERGFDGASVRDICAGAGANLGAVTYHFGGKEALFSAVLLSRIGPLLRIGREIAGRRIGPEQKLRAILDAYAMHVLHDDPALKAFFAEVLHGGRRIPDQALESVRWRNRVFADTVREGTRQGVFRECDVEHAAWIFFGMISAYILCEPLVAGGKSKRSSYSRDDVVRISRTACDLFFEGLKRRPGGAK
jgi:AcrR family transcriptional regulator